MHSMSQSESSEPTKSKAAIYDSGNSLQSYLELQCSFTTKESKMFSQAQTACSTIFYEWEVSQKTKQKIKQSKILIKTIEQNLWELALRNSKIMKNLGLWESAKTHFKTHNDSISKIHVDNLSPIPYSTKNLRLSILILCDLFLWMFSSAENN